MINAVLAGADINLREPSTGYNLVMKAIFRNDEELIYDLINMAPYIDKKAVDNLGKTPIHHVVNSHRSGSYENVNLLRFLARHYDIN